MTNGNGVAGPSDDLVVVHSSDLHLGSGPYHHRREVDELGALHEVLAAALELNAHALLLAGDIFDHNRLPLDLLDRAAHAMAGAALPIVILPGNHDPITPDSVYRRGGLADPANVHVLGITVDERLDLPDLDLESWGTPHADYHDMSPLHPPRERSMGRQIVMGHGHWLTGPHDAHRSWLIFDEDIAAASADYVALGHWDLAQPAGDGSVPAYYSGSPRYSGSVNVVVIARDGTVDVRRKPLRPGVPERFEPPA